MMPCQSITCLVSSLLAQNGPETQVRLARGVRLITLLTQDAGNTLSIRQQVQTLCLSNQDSFVVMSTPQLKRLCGLLQTVPEWLSIVIPITAVFTVLMVGMCRHTQQTVKPFASLTFGESVFFSVHSMVNTA